MQATGMPITIEGTDPVRLHGTRGTYAIVLQPTPLQAELRHEVETS